MLSVFAVVIVGEEGGRGFRGESLMVRRWLGGWKTTLAGWLETRYRRIVIP